MLSRLRSKLLVSLLAIATAAVAGVAAPPVEGAGYWVDRQIGDLADLKTLRFQGNKTFSDGAIRDYLNVDPLTASAGHRTAYLKDYVAMLASRVAAAYRHVGFNDVDVKVDFTEKDKRIDVVIEEGPRYRYGEIKASGNATVPAAELVRWLTQPTPDPKKTVGLDPEDAERGVTTWIGADGYPAPCEKAEWPTGEIASFSTFKTTAIKSLLRRAYAEHGLLDPVIDVNIVAHGGKAELVIAVRNEGAAAVIDEVVVAGNSRTAAAEIIKLVDVKPGSRFDRALRTRVERALWRSARFRSYTVGYAPATEATANYTSKLAEAAKAEAEKNKTADTGTKPKDAAATFGADPRLVTVTAGNKAKLNVTVVESHYAPPLGTALTPEQAAMLKFRTWLADCGRRGDDVRASFRYKSLLAVEIIVSPEAGWLCDVSVAGKHDGDKPHRYGFRSTKDKIGFYAFDRGTKFECTSPTSHSNLQMSLVESNDPKQPLEAKFGFVTRYHLTGSTEPTLQLRSYVSPAAAIVAATPRPAETGTKTATKVADGVLVIYGENLFARIDASTGKLLAARLDGGSLLADALQYLSGTGLDVEIRPGLLTEQLKQWDAKAAKLTNRYDEQRPWRAVGNFLLDDIAWLEFDEELTKDLRQPLRMMRQARDAGLIEPLVETWQLFGYGENVPDTTFGDHQLGIPSRFAERAFPRDSWAWVQTREFGLAFEKHTRYTRETLEAGIDDADWGPLALSCASAAAKKFDFYYMAGPWAEKGMERGASDDFARDCKPLAAESHLSGRFLHAAAKFIRGLSEDDAKVAIEAADQSAPAAAAFLKALRDQPKKPVAEVLAASLHKSWTKEAQTRLAGLMGLLIK